jgi:hypothetical protein
MKLRSFSVVPWPVIKNLAMALLVSVWTSRICFANRGEVISIKPAATAAAAVNRVTSLTRAASA